MSTTTDRIFAARVFGVVASALLGIGIAFTLYGLKIPPRGPGEMIAVLFYLVVGAIVGTSGIFIGVTSASMRSSGRFRHTLMWIFVPMVLAILLCWIWLLKAPPHRW